MTRTLTALSIAAACIASAACTALPQSSTAQSITVPVSLLDAQGQVTPAGSITISPSRYGLIFTPALSGLTPGVHGFHLHEKNSCDAGVKDGQPVPGLAAGGHWDPQGTGKHLGPWGEGHLGDLPALQADAQGKVSTAVLAPRLTDLQAVRQHALIIHAGGDNHSDHPAPLGGGGARMACGLIP
ncbi:superoxide dismutase [Cu-Zn] SodC [Amphibiibacter pelophylacis]|uniref:Superoxide dismutase [Cu-Zn] SodC n=1 Tax=Amphibiibacter pelophylacis TaxID=1799477 RepID=A0ACC6P399_9BURK